MDDFIKFVYNVVYSPGSSNEVLGEGVDVAKTRPGAREILGLDADGSEDDSAKNKFRKLSMKYHPDAEGGDPEQFSLVKVAYDTLSNAAGVGYAALGGKARNNFNLISKSSAGEKKMNYKSAVRGVNTDLTALFVARNFNN